MTTSDKDKRSSELDKTPEYAEEDPYYQQHPADPANADRILQLEQNFLRQNNSLNTLTEAVQRLTDQLTSPQLQQREKQSHHNDRGRPKRKSRKRKRQPSSSSSSSSGSGSSSSSSSSDSDSAHFKRSKRRRQPASKVVKQTQNADPAKFDKHPAESNKTAPVHSNADPAKNTPNPEKDDSDPELSTLLNKSNPDLNPDQSDCNNDEEQYFSSSNEVITTFGPKVSDTLAKYVKAKWENKLNYATIKDKHTKILMPENCQDISVPVTNSEIFEQLTNYFKKGDMRLKNIQCNMQRAVLAITQATANIISGKADIKDTIKLQLDAVSLLGHTNHDVSNMRRQKLKPALNSKYAPLCELDFTSDPTCNKFLYGEDITKSLNKAREITNLKKSIQPEKRYYNQASNFNNKNDFLGKGNNYNNGPPKNRKGRGRR